MLKLENDFANALLTLDRLAARKLLNEHDRNLSSLEFVENIVVGALEKIGAAWARGDVALSQVYMSGRICEELVDEVLPPGDPERKNLPKMAICVLSDHHLLGKTIVYSLLRASGFDLMDYGVQQVESLVRRVEEDEIEILLISVLMLPSALRIRELRRKLRAAGLQVKIIVGGAPFRFDGLLWREVGADIMCKTASEAPEAIRKVAKGAA